MKAISVSTYFWDLKLLGTYHEDRKRVGLCYPQTYEEHYLRIFVKDEHKVRNSNGYNLFSKFEAAKYAFEQTCKKFSGQLKNSQETIGDDSPIKDR